MSVLHPSFKDEYFNMAKWAPEWISKAIRLAWDMWLLFYKPQAPTAPVPVPTKASKPKTTMLAGLGNAAAAQGGTSSSNAFNVCLARGLVLDANNNPVNPLKWWLQQKHSGNTHGGLVHMVLDVLSCPGQPTNSGLIFLLHLTNLVCTSLTSNLC
ncbi:hypothetical protein PTTG_00978 [Puccinia triticina 1-1 BBBD Race 1]|uniref:HAT C-terminal dimerisation domain-containing protein n=1 Tax=Puccinia triticina (isolate 1-1 / race 1 (BBBD)) TaxID=630390 RepID=A0A0C4EJQ7_PUCT1|nr:hypothetical protein PTTG_00978 [Puccinia triticina 1-1 BBBD Race 1]